MPHLTYTQRARRFTIRFPFLSVVLSQVGFWILANLVLACILYLLYASVNENTRLVIAPELGPNLMVGFILGLLYGTVQGITDYLLDKQFFRRRSLGITFILKVGISLLTLGFLFSLVRFVLFDQVILPMMFKGQSPMNDRSWMLTFYIFLLWYFCMTLVITFIIQVNKKYGPGVLVPLLLGQYRKPREEERIFMFMDLQSSTTIAEELGHIKYSSFIRDSFMDINQVISAWQAEIYQYVGDEIVLSWRISEGMNNLACIRFYFACSEQFQKRKDYYMKQYGRVPFFKAGLHMGKITAVEIGEVKRDIAFHGDTINTAARIQGLCNTYSKSLLISRQFADHGEFNQRFKSESLGEVMLKGKQQAVEILSVEGVV